jgi:hypothetical protein
MVLTVLTLHPASFSPLRPRIAGNVCGRESKKLAICEFFRDPFKIRWNADKMRLLGYPDRGQMRHLVGERVDQFLDVDPVLNGINREVVAAARN